MDDARAEARRTRARNAALRAERREAERQAEREKRLALQKIFTNPSATPREILEAARLLGKLDR